MFEPQIPGTLRACIGIALLINSIQNFSTYSIAIIEANQ
jgi:hypothetical protein